MSIKTDLSKYDIPISHIHTVAFHTVTKNSVIIIIYMLIWQMSSQFF